LVGNGAGVPATTAETAQSGPNTTGYWLIAGGGAISPQTSTALNSAEPGGTPRSLMTPSPEFLVATPATA
jgi:hypothetical protein